MCSKKTQCIFVADGLVVVNIEEDIQSLLLEILNEYNDEQSFNNESVPFTTLQTKNGGRTSSVFSNYPIDQVPLMKSKTGNEKLQRLLEIKNKVFSMFTGIFSNEKFKYEHTISFHKYQTVDEKEQGFQAHIDFGLIAIVFTIGRDFEYSEDNGKTWLKLSKCTHVKQNSVIINFGRLYSTFSGVNPVLHRVVSKGNLGDFGYPELSKFTIGFFTEISKETIIPKEIPSMIEGKHRENWEFLKKNVKNFGEYNQKRINGSIIEEDGLLKKKN